MACKNQHRASAVTRDFGVLAGLLDLAVEQQCLPRNPIRGVTLLRRPQPKHVYLTMDQVINLIDECSQQKFLVLLLATTGLRWDEATGLQKRDLVEGKNRIRVRRAVKANGRELVLGSLKTHESRIVACPPEVMRALQEHAKGMPATGLLFTRDGGQMWGSLGKNDFFNQAVGRMVKAGRLPERITPHGLRHVAAGLMVGAGANVKVVQRQLGHKSTAMTLDTYADLFDGDLDEVATAGSSFRKLRQMARFCGLYERNPRGHRWFLCQCARRDLNSHVLRHWNLNPARLPIPPRALSAGSLRNM